MSSAEEHGATIPGVRHGVAGFAHGHVVRGVWTSSDASRCA